MAASAGSLATFLGAARTSVDEALERYLPTPPACPAIVSDAMRYSLFAGGKRLRPILTLAAADAVGRHLRHFGHPRDREHLPDVLEDPGAADLSRALPAACAIEMIHTYSLIHDDLPAMDNDTLRRGRPTLHVVYGDGIAILAGDALQADAFALLAREPAGDAPALVARRLRVIQIVANAAGSMGMVGGQAIDLQAAGQAPGGALALDAEGVRAMHARKTAAIIRAAAVGGAVMAGGTDDLVGAIDGYAADVGLAFQIIDDLLDVEGESAELGKTAGKDAAGAKPTYPALFGVDKSRQLATESMMRARHTLVESQLDDGWLDAIAEWVVDRRS